jgi:hypothetical protein
MIWYSLIQLFCQLVNKDRYVLSKDPRVEAGKNTSTVIPSNLKRRRKRNPVVSDKLVMYGYESSTTLTTGRLHYKLQTRPLVWEGAPRRRAKQFCDKRKEKVKSGHWPQRGARHQDILIDWPSVIKMTACSLRSMYRQWFHTVVCWSVYY